MNLDRFHAEMATLDGPMVVVTARAGADEAGCLVGFHTQASIDPPRYIVCLSKKNHTYRTARDAAHLGVHFLRDDQLAVAERFGEQCGALTDKFAGIAHHDGPHGVPVIDDCAHWFVGAVLGTLPINDHVAFALEPVASGGDEKRGGLLGFQAAKHLNAAHAP